MKLKWFLVALAIIALVASVFSPNSIGPALSSQGAFNRSSTGLTDLVSLLQHNGYNVEIANTSQKELTYASANGAVLFLIDPDSPISPTTARTFYSDYQRGALSMVIGESNATNEAPLLSDLGAIVTGATINDTNSAFSDQRIFDISMHLGSTAAGQIDIGSPVILKDSALTPVGYSPPFSVDSQNSTLGPRTVIAASSTNSSARAILVSSLSPFTNCGLGQCPNLNDTALILSIVNWASAGNQSRPIVIDGSSYVPRSPPIGFGVPVGLIMQYVLRGVLYSIGGVGFTNLSSSGSAFSFFGFLIPKSLLTVIQLILAVLLLLFIRGRIKGWFAREKPVKDDQPLPTIERDVVSESQERVDFLTMSRTKSFYVATLVQLYDVLDDVTKLELGAGIRDLSVDTISARLGGEKAARAYKNLRELSRYVDYANNKARILFPPGLSWNRKVRSMTSWAEQFLNDLGMTMVGKGSAQQIEYALKR